jgi:hypothetical protein
MTSDTPSPASSDVTALLIEWSHGDEAALERLLPVIYDECRRIASRQLRREDRDHTLDPTALVHEAYLRLVDQRRSTWENRAQFFGVVGQVMRRILVDYARARAILEEVRERSRQQYVPPWTMAGVFLTLGQRDSAVSWIERAFAERSNGIAYLLTDPGYAPLRGDPRYKAMLIRAGLQ